MGSKVPTKERAPPLPRRTGAPRPEAAARLAPLCTCGPWRRGNWRGGWCQHRKGPLRPGPGMGPPGAALPCEHRLKAGPRPWAAAGWPCLGGGVSDSAVTVTLSPELSGRPRSGPGESGRRPCPAGRSRLFSGCCGARVFIFVVTVKRHAQVNRHVNHRCVPNTGCKETNKTEGRLDGKGRRVSSQ